MNTGKPTKEEKRENRRLKRARKKQIRLAVKQMQPVGRKTSKALDIYAYGPNGIFQMTDGRWIRYYRIDLETVSSIPVLYAQLGRITGSSCLYRSSSGDNQSRNCLLLAFTVPAEDPIDADESLMRIEQSLQSDRITVTPVPAEEVLCYLCNVSQEEIRHAVKKRKNLRKEYLPDPMDTDQFLKTDIGFTAVYQFYMYPHRDDFELLKGIMALGTRTEILLRILPMASMELLDYRRMLETKYNCQSSPDFPMISSISLQFTIHCSSLEELQQVKTQVQIMTENAGALGAGVYGDQIHVADSIRTMGLIDCSSQYMVSARIGCRLVEELLEGSIC